MPTILPFGGRVKSASIGLDRFFTDRDCVALDKTINDMRYNLCEHMRRAFFPRTGNELRHMNEGLGLYRPSLKTDQGPAGNFLPFLINPNVTHTDLRVRAIAHEEGHAIPEAWCGDMNGFTGAVQAAFRKLDLSATSELLSQLESRRAGKGRLPFFFIRPALAEIPIVFGRDILTKVEDRVRTLIAECEARARNLEIARSGTFRNSNMVYVQPDVFVLSDGTVAVEKINCPDVGFFLAKIDTVGSRVLPHIKSIVERMREAVIEKILDVVGFDITIVTRDEVLAEQEDILEIREIEALTEAFTAEGARVRAVAVSQVDSVPEGSRLLLLNLDYRTGKSDLLLRRHVAGEVTCFPNPFFQMACGEMTGLPELSFDPNAKHGRLLMERASSRSGREPGMERGMVEALRLIDQSLTRGGLTSDILHAVLETETVPILRRGLHSWRQFVTRANRPANKGKMIRLRGIPAHPGNLILTSSTGPRLHAFRFMCVAS